MKIKPKKVVIELDTDDVYRLRDVLVVIRSIMRRQEPTYRIHRYGITWSWLEAFINALEKAGAIDRSLSDYPGGRK